MADDTRAQAATVQAGLRAIWDDLCNWWQRTHELDALDPHEIETLAHDVGMQPPEFLDFARGDGGRSALLFRRLEVLSVTPDQIRGLSNLLLADLQRTCARCSNKGRCRSDFQERPKSDEWRYYCPNVDTLEVVQQQL